MTALPPDDPPSDKLIALLCGDYLDHLNGSAGRTRAELASILLAPASARRLREALDEMDELFSIVRSAFHRIKR